MNILHHKTWHVLKKENIFKVKSDIAKAQAEEDANLRKSDISNQETYLSILRNKSKVSNHNSIIKMNDNIKPDKSDPLHLLQASTNDEHEVEKKETQEKYEKNIGLLTYLGQSVMDSRDKDELWWIKGNKTSVAQLPDAKQRKQEMLLKKDDPLESILFYQKSIDKHKEITKSMVGPKMKSLPKEDFIHKTKKSKKSHKKSKKRKHRSSSNDSDERSSKKRKKEKLREERKEREKIERHRADMVIKKSKSNRLFPI